MLSLNNHYKLVKVLNPSKYDSTCGTKVFKWGMRLWIWTSTSNIIPVWWNEMEFCNDIFCGVILIFKICLQVWKGFTVSVAWVVASYFSTLIRYTKKGLFPKSLHSQSFYLEVFASAFLLHKLSSERKFTKKSLLSWTLFL